MSASERLAEIDAELAAFAVSPERVRDVTERAHAAAMSLAEVDEALASLRERFETRVPEGASARSGSWARPKLARAVTPASGAFEVTSSSAHELPPVLGDLAAESGEAAVIETPTTETSAVDPHTDETPPIAVSAEDDAPTDERPSIEITVDVASALDEADLFDAVAPDAEAPHELLAEATAGARVSVLPPPVEGSRPLDLAGFDLGSLDSEPPTRTPGSITPGSITPGSITPGSITPGSITPVAPAAASALELELDADGFVEPPSSAKFAVPRDSEHPSPKSVIPPPSDLDADLASILADELAALPPTPPEELEAETTALFSADAFGATDEPRIETLASYAPAAGDDELADAVEIDIDDDVLVYEAEAEAESDAHAPAPSHVTRPPPMPRSAPPPPGEPGFLGRLLNRKG